MRFLKSKKNNLESRRIRTPAGNIYDKYRTKNPLYRYVTNRFLETLDGLILPLTDVRSILEVGCGEGFLLSHIANMRRFARIEGIDISDDIVRKAKVLYPTLPFSVGSVSSLCYKNDEFDLLVACEVLEHLEAYNKALDEIKRVTKRYCIISVPLEPLWQILNIARGKYILSLGSTPGHIQHWNRRAFRELIESYFTIEKISRPLPWQIALCKV